MISHPLSFLGLSLRFVHEILFLGIRRNAAAAAAATAAAAEECGWVEDLRLWGMHAQVLHRLACRPQQPSPSSSPSLDNEMLVW